MFVDLLDFCPFQEELLNLPCLKKDSNYEEKKHNNDYASKNKTQNQLYLYISIWLSLFLLLLLLTDCLFLISFLFCYNDRIINEVVVVGFIPSTRGTECFHHLCSPWNRGKQTRASRQFIAVKYYLDAKASKQLSQPAKERTNDQANPQIKRNKKNNNNKKKKKKNTIYTISNRPSEQTIKRWG